jgi:hypothetical protein
MKNFIALVFACSLVILSLMQLLSAANAPDNTSSASLARNEKNISDIGLLLTLRI